MTAPMFTEDWIRSDGKGGVIIGDADPVPAEDIPQIVAWIYQASGSPAPITLPRVAIPATGGEGGPGWHVHHGGKTVIVTVNQGLPLDEARTVAAVIASTADVAEFGPVPDPSEVERLAAFLNEQMDTDPAELARRLLGGFDVRERA